MRGVLAHSSGGSFPWFSCMYLVFVLSCANHGPPCAAGDTLCNPGVGVLLYTLPNNSPPTTINFTAVGLNGLAYGSADGSLWEALEIDSTGATSFYGITHTGLRYVAVGTDGSTEKVFHSTDGHIWNPSTFASHCTGTAELRDVTAGGGRLMAVGAASSGTAPCVHYSTDDGLSWTQGAATATTSPLGSVATDDGTNFLAAGPIDAQLDVIVVRSTDGLDFAAMPVAHPMTTLGSANNNLMGRLEYFDTGGTPFFILIGTDELGGIDRSESYYSTDAGTNWNADSTALFALNQTVPEIARGVAFSGTTLVAVGDACRVDQTTDTATMGWTGVDQFISGCSGVTFYDMVYGNGRFIAVGSDGSSTYVATSSTGATGDWSLGALGGGTFRALAAK